MARWLRDDQEFGGHLTDVARLMRYPWRNLESGEGPEEMRDARHLHLQFASRHKEELPRPCMMVVRFLRGWWHPFLNHAEL
jgi:hypothetical protein